MEGSSSSEADLLVTEDSFFPYHRFCEFCQTQCESTIPSVDYVMVTNIWNERDKIERAFKRMEAQTKKPLVWLWIDDGSVDGSYDEIERVSKEHPELEVWIERMPSKKKGDLNTIGRAYTRFMPDFVEKLRDRTVKYYTIQDVGTRPCPNYFARIISLMEANPLVGACSGTVVGEEVAREAGMPMGDCKVIKWDIISRIKKYWTLSPDTYLNIKALGMGYNLRIWRVPVLQDAPSYGTTAKGMFYQGQLNFFIGRPFLGVLLRSVRRMLLRRHGTEMLRGYFYERVRGVWRCDDQEVLKFYGYGKPPLWVILNLLRTRGRYSD